MQDTGVFDRDWRESGPVPFYHTMTFTDTGLALGRGTLLAAFAKNNLDKGEQAASPVFRDGHEARVLSLLAAAYGRPIAGSAVDKIGRAGKLWCGGQNTLARLHLALIGLPKIDERAAYHLFLAEKGLEKGLRPSDLLKALGFPQAARDFAKYNPDQPRVPAGSGRESGEWTKDESSASTSAEDDHRVQLADDVVIHVGFLVDSFVIPGPDGIPRTFCQYRSAFGYFQRSFLGTGECRSIEKVP